MSRSTQVVGVIVGLANVVGIIAALLVESTGDGLGDALEVHFRFLAFSLLGFLISLGLLASVAVRWKNTSRHDHVAALLYLAAPILSYVVLVVVRGVFIGE